MQKNPDYWKNWDEVRFSELREAGKIRGNVCISANILVQQCTPAEVSQAGFKSL